MEKEMITVIDDKGEKREAEVVLCFKAGEEKKDYVVYTFDERDEQDMVILYSARIIKEGEMVHLTKVTSEEWAMIKNVMQTIVKEGGAAE